MEKSKEPFYKKVISSIKDFDKYQEFATEGTSNALKYFFKLTLLLSIVVAIAFTIKTGQNINKGIAYIKNDSPYFKYENGNLFVDSNEGIIYENSEEFNGVIIVDTNDISEEKMAEYKKKLALYNNGILLTKDKITVKNEMLNEEVNQSYEEVAKKYDVEKFDKNTIIEELKTSKIVAMYISIYVLLFIVFAMLYILELLMEAILPMIFGYISARIIGLKLRVSNIFSIAVHAMTLPVLLYMIYIIVNLSTGFYIKYFNTMYVTIMSIYIITALFIIRSNLIKQQIELMKIIEEQKNVKEEIKERDKDQETDKEDKEKEKEKKEDKDNNIGKEANGEV